MAGINSEGGFRPDGTLGRCVHAAGLRGCLFDERRCIDAMDDPRFQGAVASLRDRRVDMRVAELQTLPPPTRSTTTRQEREIEVYDRPVEGHQNKFVITGRSCSTCSFVRTTPR